VGAHLEGAVVGTALYAGRFTLLEALAASTGAGRSTGGPHDRRGTQPQPATARSSSVWSVHGVV
jgi:hypothetical protein